MAAVPLEHAVRPVHLRPACTLAERVLLPGDPHRALAVAHSLLDSPRMFNHTRGLWGYTGSAPDGAPLTVQATGMGGPSAAIVCEELIALGARTLVRIGTCGALVHELELGDLLVAEAVIAADGTSAALGAADVVLPDRRLTEDLQAAGARPATVASTDLFFDPRGGQAAAWVEQGAIAVEMEAATVLQLAAARGVRAACVVGVTDVPGTSQAVRAPREQIERIGVEAGRLAYTALRS